jgi:hypothetical protein
MEQSWPGWPWGGFRPAAVETGGPEGKTGAGGNVGGAPAEVPMVAGAEFKGAPTWMSQRCPGSPWAGFKPAVAFVPVACPAGAADVLAGKVTWLFVWVLEGVVLFLLSEHPAKQNSAAASTRCVVFFI